nr:zinc finger, CCHC-type [Tanacetum cinerariifolium]
MIEPNDKTVEDNRKDKTAIAFLYQALPEEQLLQITKHKTAKEIWTALKTKHVGEERVQQARFQILKSEFELLHMKEDETRDTFTAKLTTLANKAASLGHIFDDSTLVRKLLNAVPDRYLQIDASIEQYSDLGEMSLEEAIGRLKAYEERIKFKKGKQVNDQEKQRIKTHERSNLVEEELEPTLLMAIIDNEREVVDQEVSLHEEDLTEDGLSWPGSANMAFVLRQTEDGLPWPGSANMVFGLRQTEDGLLWPGFYQSRAMVTAFTE